VHGALDHTHVIATAELRPAVSYFPQSARGHASLAGPRAAAYAYAEASCGSPMMDLYTKWCAACRDLHSPGFVIAARARPARWPAFVGLTIEALVWIVVDAGNTSALLYSAVDSARLKLRLQMSELRSQMIFFASGSPKVCFSLKSLNLSSRFEFWFNAPPPRCDIITMGMQPTCLLS
jgi:hypothetical protein